VKTPTWETGLSTTESSGGEFELRLSRSRAAKYRAMGAPDNDGRWSVFSQAFRVMHVMKPSELRRSSKLYTTTFMGER
jgi:hypothetical protein